MLFSSLNGLSVLIVEDEAIIAMACSDILKAAQCDVLACVATAKAAVDAALRHAPDFVLMDVRLRGNGTGIDAAEEIRARGAMYPILFTTASSEPEVLRRIRGIPRSDILPKPINYAVLPRMIRDLTARRP